MRRVLLGGTYILGTAQPVSTSLLLQHLPR